MSRETVPLGAWDSGALGLKACHRQKFEVIGHPSDGLNDKKVSSWQLRYLE